MLICRQQVSEMVIKQSTPCGETQLPFRNSVLSFFVESDTSDRTGRQRNRSA